MEILVKRGRGRPKKNPEDIAPKKEPSGRGRGRPRKNPEDVIVRVPTGKGRGRPRKNPNAPPVVKKTPSGNSKRGRPRKSPLIIDGVEVLRESVGAVSKEKLRPGLQVRAKSDYNKRFKIIDPYSEFLALVIEVTDDETEKHKPFDMRIENMLF
jgi:hypothetical protein